MFYKAVAMTVMLYGVETWVLNVHMVKALQGFHKRVARQLSNRRPRPLNDGTWEVPPIEEALEISKMKPLPNYIEKRQEYLRNYIQGRPILTALERADRLSGTPTTIKFWDEQPGTITTV